MSRFVAVCLVSGVALLPLAPPLCAQTEVVAVVVHPESEITSVSRAELSKIFLKRLRTWRNGLTVIPVDQLPENPVRERFTSQIHKRSMGKVEVYWKRMIFSGRAVPPREFATDAEVLDYVRRTPGAVGYVASLAEGDGVKRLAVQVGE